MSFWWECVANCQDRKHRKCNGDDVPAVFSLCSIERNQQTAKKGSHTVVPHDPLRVYGTRRNRRYYLSTSREERSPFLFGFHWVSHKKFYYYAQMSNCLIICYVWGFFKKENLLYSRNWSTQNFLFWKFTGCCIFFSHLYARVHTHWFEWKRVASDGRWLPAASGLWMWSQMSNSFRLSMQLCWILQYWHQIKINYKVVRDSYQLSIILNVFDSWLGISSDKGTMTC